MSWLEPEVQSNLWGQTSSQSRGIHQSILRIVYPIALVPNDRPTQPEAPSSVHLATWQSADLDPEVTRNLVQEELNQGWASKFDGRLDEAKEFFPAVAVRRHRVPFCDSQPPRLVVDSSVCGVNARCRMPERTTLPTAKDVIRCYPLR